MAYELAEKGDRPLCPRPRFLYEIAVCGQGQSRLSPFSTSPECPES